MKEVGLTHGGFYGHFASKDELVALASLRAMTETIAKWKKVVDEAPGDRLETLVDSYLSLRHHNYPETGCPLAALGTTLYFLSSTTTCTGLEEERLAGV